MTLAVRAAILLALASHSTAHGAHRPETADLVTQARSVLAREDSGGALALLDRAVREATTVEDEALARGARIEALSVLDLHEAAAPDVSRLEALVETRRLDATLGRRAALQIAQWIRAITDSAIDENGDLRARELSAIESAIEFSERPIELADALEHRSLTYTHSGEFERAFADLTAAEAIYRQEHDEGGSARCLRRNAYTAYRAGDPARSLALLDAHRPRIPRREDGSPDFTESRTHEFLRTLAALEIGDLASAQASARAFVACSAALLDGLPWGHVLRTHRSSSPATASLIAALTRHLARRPADENAVFDLASLLAETAKARLLRVALGHPVPKDSSSPASPRTIPDGVAILRYLEARDDFTGRRSLVLLAERAGSRRVIDLGESAPLHARVSALLDSSESMRSESAEQFAARSESLARALLSCALPWILEDGSSRVDRLVVLADGLLARVPLEALVLSRGDDESDYSKLDYLVRHAAVIHLPSYAVFDAIAPPSPIDAVIGVIRPRIGDDENDLRFASLEREALTHHHARAFVLEGAAATKRELLELVRREPAGWLHLACHAEADPSFRHTARLLLAPSADVADLDAAALQAPEIFTLPITRGVRVVLSACSTASGKHVEGEGVLGVWRAFLAAGASAVVSTVRDVDDRGAATWMTSFHSHAARGIPLADASRAASLAWLDGTGRPRFPRGARLCDPAHPSLWANYVCVGDDGGPLPSRSIR